MAHDHETTYGPQVREELAGPYRALREAIPDVLSGYAALGRAAMAEGELSAKTKELIALAIAITRECDGCIAAHAQGAFRRGASTAEVAEMIGVAIMMNGGPGKYWPVYTVLRRVVIRADLPRVLDRGGGAGQGAEVAGQNFLS